MAGRLIAHFSVSNKLTPELAKPPDCNIIKLPNISASISQLLEWIANPQNAAEEAMKDVYVKDLQKLPEPLGT